MPFWGLVPWQPARNTHAHTQRDKMLQDTTVCLSFFPHVISVANPGVVFRTRGVVEGSPTELTI